MEKEFWCEIFGHYFKFQGSNFVQKTTSQDQRHIPYWLNVYKCEKCSKVVRLKNREISPNTWFKGSYWE